ncbi:MAG TPA: fumarylacetoacetate hydrolase family protein [Acidimicrobiales bacterium]|nr:fumarylacetoacetate hydrolase family protein [Acidimicrobiales bacterium]
MAAIVVTPLATATPAGALHETCHQVTPTIVGTPGNDVLTGTPDADVILGLGGHDKIYGLGGDDLIFGPQQLVDFISETCTLEPGDIILTGTPEGVGMAMDPPQFLRDGDVVRIEIERLGAIEHPISASG